MRNNPVNLSQERRHIEPLVSVLVPSYNHEQYVVECLESIKDSNHKRLELILSDDCSTDHTYALSKEWAQRNASRFERVVTVRQDINLGIVKNLQFLFENAQGEYLAYLASDDMLTPSGITDRLEVFEEDGDVDAVFGNSQLISESGSVLREQFLAANIAKAFISKKLLLCALLRFWGPGGPVMMLRRTAIQEHGSLGILSDDLQFEDRYIYIRMASQGKLRFVNRVVARYRVVGKSMSRSTTFSTVARQGVLNSDQKNRHLLTGIDRLFLEMEIAKSDIEINMHAGAAYMLKKQFWRITSGLLWRAIYIRRRFS